MLFFHAIKNLLLQKPVAFFRFVFAFYLIEVFVKIYESHDIFYGLQSVDKLLIAKTYTIAIVRQIVYWPDLFFQILPSFGLIFSVGLLIENGLILNNVVRERHSRGLMFFLWVTFVLLLIRNPVVRSVHIDYLGWVMIFHLFLSDKEQKYPKFSSKIVWLFFAILYLLAGIKKCLTSEWISGRAVGIILNSELARFEIGEIFNSHLWLNHILTYFALSVEILAILFIWNFRGRILILFLSVIMHLGILVFIRIEDLTLGLLIFHIFLACTLVPEDQSKMLSDKSR